MNRLDVVPVQVCLDTIVEDRVPGAVEDRRLFQESDNRGGVKGVSLAKFLQGSREKSVCAVQILGELHNESPIGVGFDRARLRSHVPVNYPRYFDASEERSLGKHVLKQFLDFCEPGE